MCIFCFGLGAFFMGVAICIIVRGIIHKYFIVYILYASVMIAGAAIFVWALGRAFFLNRYCKYNFCDKGIWIKAPFKASKQISWEEFQEICICYSSYTTKGESAAHIVICFVKKGERKDFYGRWKADSIFHCRSVITLGYTDELYNVIKINCPYEIVDLRGNPQYMLKKHIE